MTDCEGTRAAGGLLHGRKKDRLGRSLAHSLVRSFVVFAALICLNHRSRRERGEKVWKGSASPVPAIHTLMCCWHLVRLSARRHVAMSASVGSSPFTRPYDNHRINEFSIAANRQPLLGTLASSTSGRPQASRPSPPSFPYSFLVGRMPSRGPVYARSGVRSATHTTEGIPGRSRFIVTADRRTNQPSRRSVRPTDLTDRCRAAGRLAAVVAWRTNAVFPGERCRHACDSSLSTVGRAVS